MTGIAVGTGLLAGAIFGWWAAATVAAVAAVAVTLVGRRVAGLALGVVVATAFGGWRHEPRPEIGAPPWVDQATAIEGFAASIPESNGRQRHFVLEVDAVRIGGTWGAGRGRVSVVAPLYPVITLRDEVRLLIGSIDGIDDLAPSRRGYLRSVRAGASAYVVDATVVTQGTGWRARIVAARYKVDDVLAGAAPGDGGALLAGLVTGDDHALSPGRRIAFLRTGTTHLTAISGSNIALVLTIVTTLGTVAGWRRRVLWHVSTAALVWAYAILVGLEPPAARAAVVATAAVFAVRFGRRPDFVTLIVLAGAGMVALTPGQVWSLSFQLSFAASLALAAVLSSMTPRRTVGWLAAGFITATIAQIATLPILVPTFGQLSLVSVPANLLVAPVIQIAFPLAALAAGVGLVWPSLGEALAIPARLCADYVFLVVGWLGGSERSMPPVPAPSRPVTIALYAISAVVLTVSSAEGRAWARRSVASLRSPEPRLVTALVAAAVGVALMVTARALVR